MTIDQTEVQHEMVVVRKWTAPLSWLMWVAIVLAVLPNVTPFPDLRIGAGHVLGLMALQIIASWLGSRWAARRVKQRRLSQRAPNGCASRATCLGSDELTRLVQKLRSRNNLISLAAMVMVGGQPTAAAADGLRKKGSRAAAEIGDRWHLGSVTKSMTATMIARLVEAGRIEWITPIISCLDSESEIHPLWGAVTLEQLLTHTSGAPPNFPVRTLFQDPSPGDARRQARARAIEAILRKKPSRPPGESFCYSNVGFTIAAAMAEQVTGIVWEELIGREVFEPLGIACAGFGPPKSTPGKLDQPRGHRRIGPLRFAMTEGADNSSIMGPAGSIHMTLEGLCAYGHEHLQGERGKGKLLNPDTYRRLHTPKLCDYAFGWMIAEETVSKVRVIWHNGSNTMWYAFVAIIPERNSVIAVASNDGNAENAEAAAWNIVRAQIG